MARRDDIPLRGEHNVENVLAACAAAYLAGATPAAIANGVKTFRGVEHRLEFVAEIGGVNFYNDSKATNVDAALKAMEAFPGPLLVILGGKDKGSPYTPLAEPLRNARALAILIGAAAEKIAAELGDAVAIVHAGTLDRAVQLGNRTRAAGRRGAARAGVFELRPVRELRAARAHFQGACGAARSAIRRGRPRAREERRDAAQSATRPAIFRRDAGAVPDRRGDGLQRIGGDGARGIRQRLHFLLRQLLWIALGIAGMFWLMNTDYRKLRQPRVIFTALSVTLVLLIAVFFLDRSHATHRWVRLGPLSLQPSEMAKLAVIFYLAWFLEFRRAPRGVGVNDLLRTLLPAWARCC